MATPTKGKALHVWIQDDTAKILSSLSDAVDMPESGIAARIIAAGLKAIAADGGRLVLPLVFAVVPAGARHVSESPARAR